MAWDPSQYARFGEDRLRPFVDLLARIRPEREPRLVVDMGCGDGPATLTLADRWPNARIVGIDSSPDMLARARELDVDGRVEWREVSAQDWDPADLGAPVDVLVSNAALQWVPTHRELLPQWADAPAPDGWLALQVGRNIAAPSHVLMREVAQRHPRSAELMPALELSRAAASAVEYLEILAGAGLCADAWTTTYVHVLAAAAESEAHPVLSWVRGTTLRPILDILGEADARGFLAEYESELRSAYPTHDFGVPFEFHRVFAVGHKAG